VVGKALGGGHYQNKGLAQGEVECYLGSSNPFPQDPYLM